MTRLRRLRDEEGSALVLALAFLTLFGLWISTLLAQAEVHLKTTGVVRGALAKLYDADAGIEHALRMLQTDMTLCEDVPAGTETVVSGAQMANGRSTTVTCRTTRGSVADYGVGTTTTRYAVVTTDAASTASVATQGSGAADIRVEGGPMYVAGKFDLKRNLRVTGGDVAQFNSTCPGGLSQDPKLTVDAPYSWMCTTAATPALPSVLPPAGPPGAAPAHVDVTSNCRLFKPGKYTTAPALISGGAKSNYFASGVYYFEDIGTWKPAVNTVAFGGQPKAPETKVLTASPCTTDGASGGAATGFGVRWVFGGTSALELSNKADLELYSRVPADVAEGTPGISFQAVEATGGGWKAWSSADRALNISASNAEVAIHGLVAAPTSAVNVRAKAGSAAQLLNGVVAKTLLIQETSAGAEAGLGVDAAQPIPDPRTLILTATATAPGEASTRLQAVVQIGNARDRSYAATVQSWRKA